MQKYKDSSEDSMWSILEKKMRNDLDKEKLVSEKNKSDQLNS